MDKICYIFKFDKHALNLQLICNVIIFFYAKKYNIKNKGPLVNPDKILWPKIDSGLIFPE
jgi:hypothetical protein